LLQCCIAFRGDVDTVAAIALAAAACSAEITADLPQQLHRELEDGAYGYRYIQQLDMELLALGRKK
jgi:ADP-ribosylglycohydrolase